MYMYKTISTYMYLHVHVYQQTSALMTCVHAISEMAIDGQIVYVEDSEVHVQQLGYINYEGL